MRDKYHDGPGMGQTSYRVAIKPMIPGDKPDESNFRDLESMPVRSIITNPANGAKLPAGTKAVQLRGAAWAGDHQVKQVDISTDFGATWTKAKLENPKNKYDWQRWTASVKLPSDGYFEIWTRGIDSRGVMQPHVAGFWNPCKATAAIQCTACGPGWVSSPARLSMWRSRSLFLVAGLLISAAGLAEAQKFTRRDESPRR